MSCVITEERVGSMKKVSFAWATASSSAGAATGTTSYAYNGAIERAVTIPGAAGLAPSASYDVTVTDEDSADVLLGAGANRAAGAIEQMKRASIGVVANDKLKVNITNAGSSHAGTVIVYVR